MIDLTKQLEAVHTKTGRIVPMVLAKHVPGSGYFTTTMAPCSATSNQSWLVSGQDYCMKKEWTIRNVAAPAVDWSKPVQTRSGTKAKYLANTDDGRVVVEINYGRGDTQLKAVPASGRTFPASVESADDIINVPVKPLIRFINAYADGTFGASAHSTRAAAEVATKYGKVRVGILEQHRVDGKLVHAIMHQTAARRRDYANPNGAANPWA
jgi:hypothetical protein